MAIQNRKGPYNKFDPQKLLPGEWAVITSGDPSSADGLSAYMCFKAGTVKRMATYEDMVENIDQAAGDAIAKQIQAAISGAIKGCENAAQEAQRQAAAAGQAENDARKVITAANQSKTNADAAATRANAAAENVEGLEVTDLVNRIKGMEEQMKQVGLLMYPIGSIYESTVNTNPQEYFGGTWEAFGAGRTTVGVDAEQTEFNQVKKTGGSKTQTLTQEQLPKITGRVEAGSGNKGTASNGYGAFRTASGVFSVDSDDCQYSMPKLENATRWPSGYGKYYFNMSVGGDQPHNNMPPYITVYRWVRIA